MSSRRAFLVWVSVSVKSNRSFRIALPIPLFLLLGVSDFLEDAAFFIPAAGKENNGKKMSPSSVKQIVRAVADFLREIALHTEPFDLADIDILDGQKHFKFKCLLK